MPLHTSFFWAQDLSSSTSSKSILSFWVLISWIFFFDGLLHGRDDCSAPGNLLLCCINFKSTKTKPFSHSYSHSTHMFVVVILLNACSDYLLIKSLILSFPYFSFFLLLIVIVIIIHIVLLVLAFGRSTNGRLRVHFHIFIGLLLTHQQSTNYCL